MNQAQPGELAAGCTLHLNLLTSVAGRGKKHSLAWEYHRGEQGGTAAGLLSAENTESSAQSTEIELWGSRAPPVPTAPAASPLPALPGPLRDRQGTGDEPIQRGKLRPGMGETFLAVT